MPRNKENEALFAQGQRRCSRCKTIKFIDSFHRRGDLPSGRASACKLCCGVKVGVSKEQRDRIDEKRRLLKKKKRRCYTCKKIKSISFFSKDPSQSDGIKVHCKPCHAIYMKDRHAAWRKKLRLEVLYKYGNKCACCGESQFEFLAIDHKDGGGNKHRRSGEFHPGLGFLTWLKKNNWPSGFRILCHNCNSALGYYGYCPHSKEQKTEPVIR